MSTDTPFAGNLDDVADAERVSRVGNEMILIIYEVLGKCISGEPEKGGRSDELERTFLRKLL